MHISLMVNIRWSLTQLHGFLLPLLLLKLIKVTFFVSKNIVNLLSLKSSLNRLAWIIASSFSCGHFYSEDWVSNLLSLMKRKCLIVDDSTVMENDVLTRWTRQTVASIYERKSMTLTNKHILTYKQQELLFSQIGSIPVFLPEDWVSETQKLNLRLSILGSN